MNAIMQSNGAQNGCCISLDGTNALCRLRPEPCFVVWHTLQLDEPFPAEFLGNESGNCSMVIT